MHLTTYTDYSFRVLMRLALTPDRLTTIAEIAASYGISEHHLMKVVHQLGVAGYIETHRGRGGGLRLAKDATDITVGEIVRCMEPDLGLVACFRAGETCSISSACALSPILGEALDAFLRVLDGRTLDDLISRSRQLRMLLKIEPASPPVPAGRR
ncbi:MAG: Rrf2 family transcriptional regulator [Proteobacteria bacterium]|nr:Rrf2 family transcriptional regulator [Pseudomonadota bacterium]